MSPRTSLDDVERGHIFPLPRPERGSLGCPPAIPTALSRLRCGENINFIIYNIVIIIQTIQEIRLEIQNMDMTRSQSHNTHLIIVYNKSFWNVLRNLVLKMAGTKRNEVHENMRKIMRSGNASYNSRRILYRTV